MPIDAGVDILNLDGYFFAQNLSTFDCEVKAFLDKGGIIAWGIIPTLDDEALMNSDINVMVEKFNQAIKYLVDKGISKELILRQSMVTPSCGAGALDCEQAERAMQLCKALSMKLMEGNNIDN